MINRNSDISVKENYKMLSYPQRGLWPAVCVCVYDCFGGKEQIYLHLLSK